MSRVLPNPTTVGYPVNFTSGGDKTNDAFYKHIQEIKRIYGYLQALDEGKVSADEVSGSLSGINSALTNHINSTNPHPFWKPSVSWNDLTNKPALADLSGNLPASRVVGKLTNATIDADKVNGLAKAIEDKIPKTDDSGGGITAGTLSNNGYVKFANGLIIQWGKSASVPVNGTVPSATTRGLSASFSKAFSEACYSVTATLGGNNSGEIIVGGGNNHAYMRITSWDKNGFAVQLRLDEDTSNANREFYVTYIAIGK